MSILTNPKTLYIVRLVQFLFALAFLVLVCWSGVHRGWWRWWDGINGSLAVGVIAVLFTFVITLHGIVTRHVKKDPFSGGSTIRTILRHIAELIVFLLWIASATLLLRHPGGCDLIDGLCAHPTKDGHAEGIPEKDQPLAQWDAAIALSFAQIVSFVLSALLVHKEDRATKVTGNASFA